MPRSDLQCCEKTNWLEAAQPDASLGELAEHGRKESPLALVEAEALHGVLEDVGDERRHGPPVPRRPVGGPRVRDEVAVAEQEAVHDGHDRCLCLGSRDLAKSGHWAQIAGTSVARRGACRTSRSSRARVQQANSRRMPSGSWK